MESNLSNDLKALRLHYTAENQSQLIRNWENEFATPTMILQKLTELELVEKCRRSTDRRLRAAKLGSFKQMADFDWSWPDELNHNQIEKILKLDFLDSKRNVILGGAQGLGKSMIAKNLGYQAVMRGKTVLFTTASKMILDLGSQEGNLALQRAFKKYETPDLLILDELGYLSFDCKAADFIFEIVNRRYEQGAMVITTNLAFRDWGNVFPGAACLTALVDRLTHNAEIVKLTGKSFRMKESTEKK